MLNIHAVKLADTDKIITRNWFDLISVYLSPISSPPLKNPENDGFFFHCENFFHSGSKVNIPNRKRIFGWNRICRSVGTITKRFYRFSEPAAQPLIDLDTGHRKTLSQMANIKTQLQNFTQPGYPPPPRRYTSKNHTRHPLPDERFSVSCRESLKNPPASSLEAPWSQQPSGTLDSISFP